MSRELLCGISCVEVGVQEASKRAWHSMLHSALDHSGVGGGYSGGLDWNGPRDFKSQQYGPGAYCIDTLLPIEIVVSSPFNAQGQLTQPPVRHARFRGRQLPPRPQPANLVEVEAKCQYLFIALQSSFSQTSVKLQSNFNHVSVKLQSSFSQA